MSALDAILAFATVLGGAALLMVCGLFVFILVVSLFDGKTNKKEK